MTSRWQNERYPPWARELTLTEAVLSMGCIDWVDAGDVILMARHCCAPDPDDARDLAVGVIARLIFTRLMVPGDVWDGHTPWTTSPAESVRRITMEWLTWEDPFVRAGEIVWLENTLEGHIIGEEVLRRNPDYQPPRAKTP
jgi:hypothetical protein